MILRYVPVYAGQHLDVGLVTVGQVIAACVIAVSLQCDTELIHIGCCNPADKTGGIGYTVI